MRRRTSVLLAASAAATVLCVAGCSSSGGGSANSAPASESNPVGDIPDNQVYVPYSPPDGSFAVDVPEGWARTDAGDIVSFTDKLNTVTVQELQGRPQPSLGSVRADELAGVVATGRNVTLGTVEQVTLPAGPAIHVTYSEDAPPDTVTGRTVRDDVELFVFWKAGTEALLTLSGPHGADNVDPWKTISTSFQWNI
jgi:hypothetical protein